MSFLQRDFAARSSCRITGGYQLQLKVQPAKNRSKISSEKRAFQPLTEEENDEMMALLARAHHHGQLRQSPPAKKKQNRAASPTPAATTVEKATRRLYVGIAEPSFFRKYEQAEGLM